MGSSSIIQSSTQQPDTLEKLQHLLKPELALINQLIIEQLQNRVALIPQLAGHIIGAGGKRLRPMLTLACSHLCGYQGQRHLSLAACVEFIHTATLLHDDVVDDSKLRRGRSTANSLWGNQASVLVGDFLFSRSFQLMVKDGSLDVLRILSSAAATIAEGEVLQLLNIHDLGTTKASYLEVIQSKTAALFAAACEIGGVIAGKEEAETKALQNYGLNLGILFQLIDDVLDYSPDRSEHLGKITGDDFREGKLTMPVILALQKASPAENKFWQRTMAGNRQKTEDLQKAIQLLHQHQCLANTLILARDYATKARNALSIFKESAWKTILNDLIGYCLARPGMEG